MATVQSLVRPAVSVLGKFGALPGWVFTRVVAYLIALVSPPAPVLPPYHQPKSPQWDTLLRTMVIALIVFIGLIYGFLIAIFPLFLYTYLAAPIAVVLLLTIWALPESDTFPHNAIIKLFFAASSTVCLWPNYLAVAIPGLPWITLMRLSTIPLTICVLISLSVSPKFRRDMSQWFESAPWLLRLMLAFIAIEILTLPMSQSPFSSLNRLFILQIEWTMMFFLSAYIFSVPGRATLWVKMFCSFVAFLAVSSLIEYRMGHVPWAGHLPSFLVVQSDIVDKILVGGARAASGKYRVQSIFTTSLSFAEILGLSTPFFLHFLMTSRTRIMQAALAVYLCFSFFVIITTDSRLGIIGFFASVLLYLFFGSFKRWRSRQDSIFSPAIVLSYPMIFMLFMALTLVWRRLNVMVWGGGAQQSSTDGRAEQWTMGMVKFWQWPFGYGQSQGGVVVGWVDLAGNMSLDSYYLSILIEFGIIGFIAYFGMLLLAASEAFIAGVSSKDKEIDLLMPLGIMIIVFIIGKGVLSQTDNHTLFFVMLGMLVALLHRSKSAKKISSPSDD